MENGPPPRASPGTRPNLRVWSIPKTGTNYYYRAGSRPFRRSYAMIFLVVFVVVPTMPWSCRLRQDYHRKNVVLVDYDFVFVVLRLAFSGSVSMVVCSNSPAVVNCSTWSLLLDDNFEWHPTRKEESPRKINDIIAREGILIQLGLERVYGACLR